MKLDLEIPEPTEEDIELDWKVNYEFLTVLHKEIKNEIFSVDVEELEVVILGLLRLQEK